MNSPRYLLLITAAMLPIVASGQVVASGKGVDTSPIGESAERHLSDPFTPWTQDLRTLKTETGDSLEMRQVATDVVNTVKLKNVVPPIRFESGNAKIPPSYVDKVRNVLASMKDRKNVRLHFVGHADNQRLSETLVRTFGDNAGLSRERAGEVAEFFKTALGLAAESISYEWAGDTRPIATNATADGRALNRRVEVEVWYDEIKGATLEQEVLVPGEFKRLKVCRMETVCKLRYLDGHARRARVKNVVPPLRYDDESIAVTAEFIKQVEQALDKLRDKGNVQVRFIGYSDGAALSGRNERIYGNALALSKARAHRVVLAIQEALKLPSAALASDGRGAALPLASNETAQGRALNRRVEVEFWHDDPLQELPDEPQICPVENAGETVTKVYDPPWGSIPTLTLENGQPVIPAGYTDSLRRAMADIADRSHVRLRFVGYTKNETLDRRTASVYGDDIGLSVARARRALDVIRQQMTLTDEQVEHEGRGYVHSADVVNAGFIQGEDSYVAVQVVYDEAMPSDSLDGVDITKLTREFRPKDPYGLNLMRIAVNGQPIDDPGHSSADIQRCTDVALDRADIQLQFDNFRSAPRLAVTASPSMIAMRSAEDLSAQATAPAESNSHAPTSDEVEPSPEEAGPDSIEDPTAAVREDQSAPELPRFIGSTVKFQTYINYSHFIDRAEVRIFDVDQSVEATPVAIVNVDAAGTAKWEPIADRVSAPNRELKYVLRVYDKVGHFDETRSQSLWMTPEPSSGRSDHRLSQAGEGNAVRSNTAVPVQEQVTEPQQPQGELLAGFGNSDLALHNITLGSGTVKVRGSGIPADHTVWIAGRQAPVDAQGNFVAEEIMPTGAHTVEIAVLDQAGNGTLFLRDLEFKRDDWFYVGIADLTWSDTKTNGPAALLQGENPAYDVNSSLDGRLAFFLKGKFLKDWKLTASADTREGPVDELFSNFMSKSPESLFRRIDPDYYYPTFGDDSTVEELAPTSGKFFVKVNQRENYGMWGNFKVDYVNNELAQVDRGLYGGNVHFGTEATTSFGERRLGLDGFAAEPGTVPSREEFRGTGGSLYFLKRQDLLVGSERLRVELRDKDSGIVTGVVNLSPGIDYDIDYLQGRVLLSEPLSSTVDDKLLVRSSGLSGDEAYLVVRYEYTPGFEEIDALSTGGQAHYWINDYLKIGVTTNRNDDAGADSTLNAADVTIRKSADSWIKVQAAESDGLVANSLFSDDGGFAFNGTSGTPFLANSGGAYRADVSLGFADWFDRGKGRVSAYVQSLDAGYSAPGMNTLTNTEQYGGRLSVPITDKLSVGAKADSRIQDLGLKTEAQELNVAYRLTERWTVSSGVRNDERIDRSPIVPLTQDQGRRTDAVVQVGFDSKAAWRTYGFVQETLSTTEEREENARIGAGGAYRVTERFRVDAEVSNGDLGAGGRLGTNYMHSEKTNLYLNYSLENERGDNGLYGRRGNLISGVKRRLSDSSSVYVEERYQDTDWLTGLTHATGINFTLNQRWNFGANADVGTLKHAQTGAETDRRAGGVRVGFSTDKLQIASAIEYRSDEIEQLNASVAERKTWLFRNNFKYQLTPDWRVLGKFNHSKSDSTLGEFYDGKFTEAVLGYAYRPVKHDRLNLLAKYTYFYNVPTTEQVTLQNTAAEFIQKSQVAALDLTYDLTRHWTIGGKYAYRMGQVSLDRVNPVFFDNKAQLYVARLDFHFAEAWEVLVEARALDLPDLKERRSGALGALYRQVGKHVKVGAGYNFTDFSDDLTDLSYDHRGAFVNVVGAL